MKKEYETARLFKNNRASDCLSTEELHDSEQQQSTDACKHSTKTNQTCNSFENSKKPSLPQRFLIFLQRVITVLGLDHKG